MHTPISSVEALSAAPLTGYHGTRAAARYSGATAEHLAVRKAAGLFDFPFRAMCSATGSDRARFLHNMVTNDIKGLTPGRGVYAAMLDLRGHILADLHVYCDADRFLVSVWADLMDKVLATLGRYNIGGRVPLEILPQAALSIQGPKAGTILQPLLPSPLPGPEEDRHAQATIGGQAVRVIKSSSTGEEGYELWTSFEGWPALRSLLMEHGREQGLIPCGCEALETLRIEAGIAAYGAELGEDTLPLEAGLQNALSFTKGCYIGQEIVERARSRGHVNWKLVGFWVDSQEAPPPGEKLLNQGKPLGEITSACFSPTLARTIALGYTRRETAEPGTRLQLASGVAVEVAALPFYPSHARP